MNTDVRFEAIKELYPQTGSVQDGLYAFDPNGNPIDIDESKIKPVYEKKLAEYNSKKYQLDRAVAYDPISEQLDQIYHDMDGWKAKIKAVKDKYPKPK